MKKTVIILLLALFVLTLSGCGMFGPENENFDNESIKPVEGQEGYYTDDKLSFCAEIRGSYKSDRPFTLDAQNENLRVWDNMYLYEYDYFQIIVNGSPTIFYSVNSEDLEYVTVDDRFAHATVNDGKSGIYKITFDLSTKMFDLEFKSEITTPVYEKMNGCDVHSLKSGFTQLTVNPANPEELMIANYSIDSGELISFYNHGDVHLSNYKVILDESVQGKYASAMEDGDKHVSFAIGGIYNLYINPVTYNLRVELTNPDSADYSLQVYENGEPVKLTASDPSLPYLFSYQVTVNKYASIPILISDDYIMYNLDVNSSDYTDKNDYITTPGTYLLEINLKSFTVTVHYVPQ